jgi:hypothetical protein
VIPNERRATRPERIWGATRRDGAIFPQCGVAARLCRLATRRSRRRALQQNGLRRDERVSVNRPWSAADGQSMLAIGGGLVTCATDARQQADPNSLVGPGEARSHPNARDIRPRAAAP